MENELVSHGSSEVVLRNDLNVKQVPRKLCISQFQISPALPSTGLNLLKSTSFSYGWQIPGEMLGDRDESRG